MTDVPLPDPHASKIPADDPRLRLRAASGRTLRKGPAIALVALGAGALTTALIVALLPPSKGTDHKDEDARTASLPPVVPDAIRNAPDPAPYHPPSTGDKRTGAADAGLEPLPTERTPSGGRDPRIEQELRAKSAAITFEGARDPSESTMPAPPAAAAMTTPAAHGGANASEGDPNLQDRKNAFLESDGAGKRSDYLQAELQHPRSPFEIKAGTILPAVLITGINSDLPGPVIGQVRENAYDTVSGNFLLIPQGARLLAQYDSMVAWGQERVLVCWNRLVFPNGDSIRLDCMPAADLEGAAGLTDEVNEHWARIVKGAAIASLLAATTQAVAGSTEGMNPTLPQAWARGGASEMNQVGQQLTRRNLNIQPTITVRPGFSLNVVVTKDMVLPGPYRMGS